MNPMRPLFAFFLFAPVAFGDVIAQPAPDPSTPDSTTPEMHPPGMHPPGESTGKDLDFLQRTNLILAKVKQNERNVDPFGMPMDPANIKEVPILPEAMDELEETPVLTSSLLKNALQNIPITGVYPSRNIVVVGARTFSLGDVMGLKLEGLTIRLRFRGIKGTSILFEDMETREVASVEFNVRPKEFEPIRSDSKREVGEGIQAMNELFIVN